MPDIAQPISIRLMPAHGADLFDSVAGLSRDGRLTPILGSAAPRRVDLSDGSLIHVGPDLFVLFGVDEHMGGLDITIGRSRLSNLSATAFQELAAPLGQALLRFLLAVLDIGAVTGADGDALSPGAHAMCSEGQAGPIPLRVTMDDETGRPLRPLPGTAPRIAMPKLQGHGFVPGLPTQMDLNAAMRPPRPSAASYRRQAPTLAIFALPLLLALAWTGGFGGQGVYAMWSDRGFSLTDLTEYQQTAALLETDPTTCDR